MLSKQELQARSRGYGLVWQKGRIMVKIGKEYKQYLSAVAERIENMSKIKGIGVAPGLVRGRVRVAPNVFTLGKVKKGDILVTVVTHPDYLPAMRRARAIVTDEGGLISHAAIVCRELGIPCIVGTKIATKVLKDDDLVEVDAQKGTVRKIK